MSKKMASILFLLSLMLLIVGAAFAPIIFAEGGGEDLVDPAPPPPEMPSNPYGAYFDTSLAHADTLREADALWTTLFLNWRDVEASPGQYNWAAWDEPLGRAADLGYQVVITINGNPTWAADTACGPIREEHLDDFATFVRKAVERYSYPPYNVLYWAFYNEPDNSDMVNYGGILGGCWGYAWNPNAAPGAGGDAYASMLKHVYPAVKAANPNAYVVMGGLAYDYFTTDPGGGLFDPYFLTDVLEAGGGDYFDVLNFHYYPWSADIHWEPVGANRYERHLAFKARWIATEVYNAIGERKPIMITEVGETSHNKDNTPDYRRQIWTLFETFMHARMVNAYPILWFTGADLQFSINYDGRRYGLLMLDGTTKPSYYAYKTLVEELKEADFVRPRDDLPSRFEGYVFNDRGRMKQVIWMYAGHPDFPPPQPLDLPVATPGGSMRVVRVRSYPRDDNDLDIVSEYTVTDGGLGDADNKVDGKIRVMIEENYQFFEDISQPMYTPTPTPTPTPLPHIDIFLPVFYR